ncbi:MAG: glutamyl-tRNA reductase [Gemmataceae bacterium]
MLLVVGCSFRTAELDLRERLAFDERMLPRALDELNIRFGCEAVIVSTCNRVELYLARLAAPVPLEAGLIAEFLSEFHELPADQIGASLYHYRQADAVRHLFRVVASLDSLIVGEGQIAGQVRRAVELAEQQKTVGPVLRTLFQHARLVSGRVRSETGLAKGHVSVSSAAVDYVRQVFSHFGDKTILVIGAGKMGELTLRHLRSLEPKRILVTNRSPAKAEEVARGCAGEPVPWEQLDEALVAADIVLSTTGAPEPIMTRPRWQKIAARRAGTSVILDIAVPRDFDPTIHDGDRTCLFNIDDLKRIREQTLAERERHLPAAEGIIAHEQGRFVNDWKKRRHGPTIARLTEEFEAKRRVIVAQLLQKLDSKLDQDDKAYVEGAFRLLQNQFLHGPISALAQDADEEKEGHTLLNALRKLFGLHD